MNRRGALALFGALGVGFWPSRASATIARALSVEDLVHKSNTVVLATALEQASSWQEVGDSRRIVTTTRVRIDELVTGQKPDAGELMVQTLGGKVGKIGQLVEGEAELVPGRASLLFARGVGAELFAVTAMAQGHFPIARETRGRVLHKSAALPALIDAPNAAIRRLDGSLLADALRLVRATR